jgi:hypothetical protein
MEDGRWRMDGRSRATLNIEQPTSNIQREECLDPGIFHVQRSTWNFQRRGGKSEVRGQKAEITLRRFLQEGPSLRRCLPRVHPTVFRLHQRINQVPLQQFRM